MKTFSFQVRSQLCPELLTAIRRDAAAISREGFGLSKRRCLVFARQIGAEGLQGCVLLNPVTCRPGEAGAQVQAFLLGLGIPEAQEAVSPLPEEEALSALFQAFREGFLDGTDEVLDAFLALQLPANTGLIKSIRPGADRESLLGKARGLCLMPGLLAELERVFQPASHHPCRGHPVHYLLETEEQGEQEEALDLLLSALYLNRRLQRRRFLTLACDSAEALGDEVLQKAAAASRGGALVLDFNSAGQDSAIYNDTGEYVCRLMGACEAVKGSELDVLLVFCLPAGNRGFDDLIRETLGDTAFVKINQDLLSAEAAAAWLEQAAGREGASPDKDLQNALSNGQKGFSVAELRDVFKAWYKAYLMKTVYPQYGALPGLAKTPEEPAPEREWKPSPAYAKLQGMVGLYSAKQAVDQLLTAHRASRLFSERGLPGDFRPPHLLFTGNPGTAKTTVARLYAQILRDEGILETGELIEVGRADLVGKYVGWTARLVKQHFERAKGGILFVDEAYSLLSSRHCNFSEEAINTLVLEMENHREDTVVILAGYPAEMENLVAFNPGLRSRIGLHVSFEDYSPEEMLQILRLLAKEQGLALAEETGAGLLPWLQQACSRPDAGNGRLMRNLLDKARLNQARRLLSLPKESLTDEGLCTLLAADFETPPLPARQRQFIGFRQEAKEAPCTQDSPGKC